MEKKNDSKNKASVLINFKKAQSHLAKVIQMVEKGEYCISIMQQNLAVIGLLKSAHQMLMKNHLNSCFINAMSTKNNSLKQRMVVEVLNGTNLFNR